MPALMLIGMPPLIAFSASIARGPSLVTGTYLITLRDERGAFTSRSLVTFFADGNLSSVDSLQQAQCFGDSLGMWACTGPRGNRVELQFRSRARHRPGRPCCRARSVEAIEGAIGLSFFGIQGDPLGARSPDVDAMAFTGRFVPVVKIAP